ncbi:MAG: NAD-dependent epimerase/dehydratase family protein [Verrucomicrobiota bacterium]
MKILIIGAGYVGKPWLERRSGKGDEVVAVVRTENSQLGMPDSLRDRCHVGDVTRAEFWESLPSDFDLILYSVSTQGRGVEGYVAIHRTGLAHALAFARKTQARFFYTSSTSVYSQNDDSTVQEEDVSPQSDSARILLKAEERVIEFGGTVLRLSGIYGPGRTYHLKRLEGDDPRLPGDGQRFMNMIHLEDILGALDFLVQNEGLDGEVYNVTDSEPTRLLDLYEWLCPQLGKAVPPLGGEEFMKRGLTSKRISNAKLRSKGWELQYPSFREGYTELLAGGSLPTSPQR